MTVLANPVPDAGGSWSGWCAAGVGRTTTTTAATGAGATTAAHGECCCAGKRQRRRQSDRSELHCFFLWNVRARVCVAPSGQTTIGPARRTIHGLGSVREQVNRVASDFVSGQDSLECLEAISFWCD